MNFIDPMGLGRLGRDGFFTGVGRGLLQSGYDLFIANDAGPYMTGLGILWGAEPGPIFPPPSSLAESIGRVTGSVGSAVAGGAAIGLSATRGAREAGNAISQVNSPLKSGVARPTGIALTGEINRRDRFAIASGPFGASTRRQVRGASLRIGAGHGMPLCRRFTGLAWPRPITASVDEIRLPGAVVERL